MNILSPKYIRDYLLAKFKDNHKLSSDDTELNVPSIFIPSDDKRHMWINLDTGLWQCFKTGNTGNFIKLYSRLENITYKKAYDKFLVESFLSTEPEVKIEEKSEIINLNNFLNNECKEFICDFSYIGNDPAIWLYLFDRNLIHSRTSGCFYSTTSPKYENRLIIPYIYNRRVALVQARALGSGKPKYLNFGGVKTSNILYPYEYSSTEPLFICEGVFDALTLKIFGYNSTTATSCSISNTQAKQLSEYAGELVLAFDNDSAGRTGVKKFDALRRKLRMREFSTVFPPKDSKDWNEAFKDGENSKLINILDNPKKYNFSSIMNEKLV